MIFWNSLVVLCYLIQSYSCLEDCLALLWFITPSERVTDEVLAASHSSGWMVLPQLAAYLNRLRNQWFCKRDEQKTVQPKVASVLSIEEQKHRRLHCDERCDERCAAACAAVASLPRGGRDCIFRREWAYSPSRQRQALCLRMLGLLWPGYF